MFSQYIRVVKDNLQHNSKYLYHIILLLLVLLRVEKMFIQTYSTDCR